VDASPSAGSMPGSNATRPQPPATIAATSQEAWRALEAHDACAGFGATSMRDGTHNRAACRNATTGSPGAVADPADQLDRFVPPTSAATTTAPR
jgi:hypothetical protein